MKHLILVALWSLIALAAPVLAHEWYPIECCSGQDCAPVTKMETLGSLWVVTTKHGTALVGPNIARRPSKDARMHACMRPNDDGKMELLCIFVPPMF